MSLPSGPGPSQILKSVLRTRMTVSNICSYLPTFPDPETTVVTPGPGCLGRWVGGDLKGQRTWFVVESTLIWTNTTHEIRKTTVVVKHL